MTKKKKNLSKLGRSAELLYSKTDLETHGKGHLKYFNSIDELIVKYAPKKCNYLDVGAGDGSRALQISKRIQARSLHLVEPNPELANRCKTLKNAKVYVDRAESFSVGQKFDVITCLWSVFGHVENPYEGLINIKRHLAPEGLLFLDVNNRYNAAEYGWKNVSANMMRDALNPHKKNGYFPMGIHPEVSVYLYHPWELDRFLKKAGLAIVRKCFVHYRNGRVSNSPFAGQVMYVSYR